MYIKAGQAPNFSVLNSMAERLKPYVFLLLIRINSLAKRSQVPKQVGPTSSPLLRSRGAAYILWTNSNERYVYGLTTLNLFQICLAFKFVRKAYLLGSKVSTQIRQNHLTLPSKRVPSKVRWWKERCGFIMQHYLRKPVISRSFRQKSDKQDYGAAYQVRKSLRDQTKVNRPKLYMIIFFLFH